MSDLLAKRDHLLQILAALPGEVVIAFSAGVDSTVLAQAAQLACGDRALAVIADSPSLPAGTLTEAEQLARQIGIRLQIIQPQEFERPEYQANQGNRCYFCKDSLYQTLTDQLAGQEATLLNGTNTDDLSDYRPGLQAAQEHQVRSPFVEAEINKADIRELARLWNLPVWDKPASPCLSSRIAPGVTVTVERVRRVDAAEQFLKTTLGLRELRVRCEAQELARIEVPITALPLLTADPTREQILHHFQHLGFRAITLDLAGFRTGNLNELISLQTK